MMDFAGADEMEKYRKYIQKRRVSPHQDDVGDDKPKRDVEDEPARSETGHDRSSPFTMWNEQENNSARYGDDEGVRPSDYRRSGPASRAHNSQNASLPTLHRADTGLYKKLYAHSGRNKSPAYPTSYPSTYKGYTGSHAEVEDNRVTLIAVKLIKQALACFAILGIIILMQSRPDMKEALAVVKKQVIETNIEPQSLYEGIRGIINQCSQALGGSP